MARDPGLEALIDDDLGPLGGLTTRTMFGGWVWLLKGNLLCGARQRGLLVRLHPDDEPWALDLPGITPVVMRGRSMPGWINASAHACADDDLRRQLLTAALGYVLTLPPK